MRNARRASLGWMAVLATTTFSAHQDRPPDRVVHVVAERFVFTPPEITIDEGTRVQLRITSEDTTHGFRLLGPGDVNVEIPRRGRGEARVDLEVNQPGTYAFECSRICGAGHGFMRGTLRVRARTTGP